MKGFNALDNESNMATDGRQRGGRSGGADKMVVDKGTMRNTTSAPSGNPSCFCTSSQR